MTGNTRRFYNAVAPQVTRVVVVVDRNQMVSRLRLKDTLVMTVISAALSTLLSNVPAVLLFKPFIPHLAGPRQAWLTLARSPTLAGNLTILGSVANRIAVELARASGIAIAFREYLRAGVPVTLLTLGAGVFILWLGGAR